MHSCMQIVKWVWSNKSHTPKYFSTLLSIVRLQGSVFFNLFVSKKINLLWESRIFQGEIGWALLGMSLGPLRPESGLIRALAAVLLQGLSPSGGDPPSGHAPGGVVVVVGAGPSPLQDLGGRCRGHVVVHGNCHLEENVARVQSLVAQAVKHYQAERLSQYNSTTTVGYRKSMPTK